MVVSVAKIGPKLDKLNFDFQNQLLALPYLNLIRIMAELVSFE